MKKKLPNIFKNSINKPLNNNTKVFYSAKNNTTSSLNIDDLFKHNQIYRTNVKISLKDGSTLIKTIIGRSLKHLITIDNELINIENILTIEKN